MTRRRVTLLTACELTAGQLAQRKYRRGASAKSKQAGYWAAWYAKPENRAKAIKRATKWQRDHRVVRRVYNRIWTATKRRLQRARLAPA